MLPSEDPPDEAKNEECYAELIQFLDDDGGRKALKILREHYASQSNALHRVDFA